MDPRADRLHASFPLWEYRFMQFHACNYCTWNHRPFEFRSNTHLISLCSAATRWRLGGAACSRKNMQATVGSNPMARALTREGLHPSVTNLVVVE